MRDHNVWQTVYGKWAVGTEGNHDVFQVEAHARIQASVLKGYDLWFTLPVTGVGLDLNNPLRMKYLVWREILMIMLERGMVL